MGGRFITRYLSKEFNCSYEEAQALKHKVNSLSSPDLRKDDKIIADKITLATEQIIREIKRTLHSYNTKSQEPIETAYISSRS